MTKILLTGGSGFIAAHILETLLARGYSVVTTVRSQDKAKRIHDAHADLGKDRLETAIVPDIAVEGAFDEVVKTPGIDVVVHTASPFHFNITDPKKDLVDPAVIGTTGILKAIARSAPGVKRVVITSSVAAISDPARATDPTAVFTEASWNPVTLADIHDSPMTAYRASKKLAEAAAWAFVADGAPNFDLVTVNPPLVFGPVVHHLVADSLASINTSNERLGALVQGKWRTAEAEGGGIPETGTFLWVDVRDVAELHVRAFERPALGGARLFATGGRFCNRQLVEIVRAHFPALHEKLPAADAEGGDFPPEGKLHSYDNSKTTEAAGMQWTPLEKTVVDTVKSLLPFLS